MPALVFAGVDLVRDGVMVLQGVDWFVERGQRWVVLGPNGSGKTSLLQLAGGYAHPSRGTVEVLGRRLGRVDVRALRARLALTSAAVANMLRPGIRAAEVVMTGKHAALETWWHDYDELDRRRAAALLAEAGFAGIADRRWAQLSEGERQQVLLARALMGDPELVLLDEPNSGLDLAARERLLSRLAQLAADPAVPTLVLVTHHVEEIPPGFGHLLLLREGRVVSSGAIDDTLTEASLDATFGVRVRLTRQGGRWALRGP
ncbi:MAG TPA: ATP-binding cassette domain-containing protein [Acidimicrobiales bacterium]|nr:ATP-binding cassette domain-containing protein [Acidimicrobiales bacterium]